MTFFHQRGGFRGLIWNIRMNKKIKFLLTPTSEHSNSRTFLLLPYERPRSKKETKFWVHMLGFKYKIICPGFVWNVQTYKENPKVCFHLLMITRMEKCTFSHSSESWNTPLAMQKVGMHLLPSKYGSVPFVIQRWKRTFFHLKVRTHLWMPKVQSYLCATKLFTPLRCRTITNTWGK